jgi:hypothetical protein
MEQPSSYNVRRSVEPCRNFFDSGAVTNSIHLSLTNLSITAVSSNFVIDSNEATTSIEVTCRSGLESSGSQGDK